MSDDEFQIRTLVSTWHSASQSGDTEAVLALMTEDVVFLTPGNEPMTKQDFASLSRSAPGAPRPRIESSQDIREIQISGDMAFLVSALRVTVFPGNGDARVERNGHTLTIFKKAGGKWLLARDANLLSNQPQR
jgi:uncharacterized protein (TIGR02246 family)